MNKASFLKQKGIAKKRLLNHEKRSPKTEKSTIDLILLLLFKLMFNTRANIITLGAGLNADIMNSKNQYGLRVKDRRK